VLLAALLATSLSSAPAPALVVTRREGASAEEAAELVARIHAQLVGGGLGPLMPLEEARQRLERVSISDPAACEGRHDCAVDLGQLLDAPVIIALELGALRRVWAVHLEVFSVTDSKSLVTLDQAIARRGDGRLQDLGPLIDRANEALRTAGAARSDVPLRSGDRLNPALHLSAVTTQAFYGLKRRSVGLVTTGLAVSAAAAAVAFLVVGKNQQAALAPATLPDGTVLLGLPRERARAQADAANLSFTLALSTGLLSGALAVVSAWLFTTEDLPRED